MVWYLGRYNYLRVTVTKSEPAGLLYVFAAAPWPMRRVSCLYPDPRRRTERTRSYPDAPRITSGDNNRPALSLYHTISYVIVQLDRKLPVAE
eukprot:scaffold10568_cov64-Cyclotella_meneghiniana.AAC.9